MYFLSLVMSAFSAHCVRTSAFFNDRIHQFWKFSQISQDFLIFLEETIRYNIVWYVCHFLVFWQDLTHFQHFHDFDAISRISCWCHFPNFMLICLYAAWNLKTSAHFQNCWKMSVYFYPIVYVQTDSKIKRVLYGCVLGAFSPCGLHGFCTQARYGRKKWAKIVVLIYNGANIPVPM